MSNQIICDECGEAIDPTVAYYSATVQQLQQVEGATTQIEGPVQRDWHADHAPIGQDTFDG